MNLSWKNTPPPILQKELQRTVNHVQQELTGSLPQIIAQIDCSYARSPRNFAATIVGNPTIITICEDLAEQPLDRIRGILYHELGHILQWIKESKPPKNMDLEQQADFLVEALCGIKIYYDENLVQTLDPKHGVIETRPAGLR